MAAIDRLGGEKPLAARSVGDRGMGLGERGRLDPSREEPALLAAFGKATHAGQALRSRFGDGRDGEGGHRQADQRTPGDEAQDPR